MPSTNNRKMSESALKRMEERYIDVDDKANPMHLYIPLKRRTEEIRALMDGKNYFRLMTQTDKNQYIVLQFYIYCEADVWMCGDALVFNQEPNKKIWQRVMCTATKAPCIAYSEDEKEFLSVCPKCKKAIVLVKDTPYRCVHCKFYIPQTRVNQMPWAKLNCSFCPAEIGWEKCQEIKEIVFESLVPRIKEDEKLPTNISELFTYLVKELGNLR